MAQHRDVRSRANAIQPKTSIGKSGTRQYHRRIPQFWSDVIPTSQTLHPTIVSLSCNDAGVRSLAPMLILTRCPLPKLESYNSFLKGIPVTTQLRNGAPVILDAGQLQLLGQFTVRLCRIVMNKPFVSTLDDMLFFFAPIDATAPDETGRTPSVVAQISWEMVTRFVMTWSIPINAETPECIEQAIHDAIIQDRRTEFTRRFEVIKLRRDLTPFSRIADQCGESNSSSLLDVIKSKSQSFAGIKYHAQPIIEASVVEYHANYLSPTIPPPTKPDTKYLIPELCNKLTIPASILRTALILPSVLHRIDQLLLVKELNANIFENVISDSLLNIAATCPSACMEFDYERLELLGDAFLKYLSSIYIAAYHMSKTEHAMHEARQRMVNNKTLTQIALQAGLPMYIQSRPFVSKHWKPSYFEILPSSNQLLLVDDISALVEYHQPNQKEAGSQDQIHWLADKTIADVTEAIIGSAYLSGGDELAFNVAKMLGLAMPLVDQWQYLQDKISVTCPNTPARPSSSQGSSASLIDGLVGLKFRRPELLSQALSRQNTVICGTLTFVGDAILEFLVVKYVFEREPRLSSGGLSLLKAAMVSNSTLATIFVSAKLSNGLSYGPRDMTSLNSFANMIEILRNEEYKRAETEKRSPGQFWRTVEPPKMLVTLLKSIIGALCMSNAPSHVEIESLFENEFKSFYDKHITIKTLANRPLVAFVELLRAHGCYQFDIKKEDMNRATRCQVILHDHVLATVEDQTASYAVMSACRSALGMLEANAMVLSVYCNCKAQSQKRRKDGFLNRLLVLEEQ
ncbi:Ribonuclease III domain containing protein [Amanita muscaria]